MIDGPEVAEDGPVPRQGSRLRLRPFIGRQCEIDDAGPVPGAAQPPEKVAALGGHEVGPAEIPVPQTAPDAEGQRQQALEPGGGERLGPEIKEVEDKP